MHVHTYNIRLALNGIPHTPIACMIYRVAEDTYTPKELCVLYNYIQVKPLVEEKKELQQEYRLSILEQLTTVALDMVRNLPLGS